MILKKTRLAVYRDKPHSEYEIRNKDNLDMDFDLIISLMDILGLTLLTSGLV